jgi:tRNA (guanosine-2'-O-)-methyltransferase
MDQQNKQKLVTYLQEFVTKERWERINTVIGKRTRFLSVVLEDLYQPHNASAVLRSCDCFGIQDIHIIENENTFNPSKGVTIGSDQWLSLHQYNKQGRDNTAYCYRQLKDQGYKLIATTPHADDLDIDEVPLDQKTALVFGSELTGLSEQAIEMADGYAKIPMVGFSESFNISVSAALCLYEVSSRLRRAPSVAWELSAEEKLNLQYTWLKQSIRAADMLVERYFEDQEEGSSA